MLQSLAPGRKKYFGTFHAFYQIAKEEHDARKSFLYPFYNIRSLIPTMLYNTVSPLIRYLSTRCIEEQLGLSSNFNPILYKASQILFLGIEAFITCPLELVRSRIFACPTKTKSSNRSTQQQDHIDISNMPSISCVEMCPSPPSGILDCLFTVVVHEGGRSGHSKPRTNKISIDEWESVYGGGGQVGSGDGETDTVMGKLQGYLRGIASLYRGFWPRYVALLIQFLSSEINKEDSF
jgi:hypothetical protein